MLFTLPDDDTLYTALENRDPRYDGQAFVGVTSTGIFCRLTCPARNPKRENCRFFASAADCLTHGFRPCLRCHPAASGDPSLKPLLKALNDRPDHRWSEADVIAMGIDPSTARRAFKRQFGMTFLDLARQRRLARGFTTLADGNRVIDAQLDAGYASASAFRAAFALLIGLPPGKLKPNARLRADFIDTPLGDMIAVADNTHLYLLEFSDRKALPAELKSLHKDAKGDIGLGRTAITDRTQTALHSYFTGENPALDLPIATGGSAFAQTVWQHLRQIPPGQTQTYSQIAAAISRPSATRAVARANGANRLAIVVPCHRVLGADGSLTGYGGGLWRKDRLIALERQYL